MGFNWVLLIFMITNSMSFFINIAVRQQYILRIQTSYENLSFGTNYYCVRKCITLYRRVRIRNNTANVIKNYTKRGYSQKVKTLVNLGKTFGCPNDIFGCNYKTVNKTNAEKYLKQTLQELGLCSNLQYYISKKPIDGMTFMQNLCCKANLLPGVIKSKEDLNCLTRHFSKINDSKKNTKVATSIWDYYLNGYFVSCPGGDLVNNELWAFGHPDKCAFGKCETSAVFVDLCLNCSTTGYHAVDPNELNSRYLCMKEIKPPNATSINYYKAKIRERIFITIGCPLKLYTCNLASYTKKTVQKNLNETFQELGLCKNRMYYTNKKLISIAETMDNCCKANLTRGFIYDMEDLDCLANHYESLYGKTKRNLNIGAFDYDLNRVFRKCPGGETVNEELWASGQPDKCKTGTCETPHVYVKLCRNCAEKGLSTYLAPNKVYELCMKENYEVKAEAGMYTKEIISAFKFTNYLGCPAELFQCKNYTSDIKKTNINYFNMTYKELAKCGNRSFFVTKKPINALEHLQTCCRANLSPSFIYNKQELDCLVEHFSRFNGSSKFKIGAWDIYLNRTFKQCPGETLVNAELWAKNQPENCANGTCVKPDLFVDLCLNCKSRGLNVFYSPTEFGVLCMNESQSTKKNSRSKLYGMYKNSVTAPKSFLAGCPAKFYRCNYKELKIKEVEKHRDEKLLLIGKCGKFVYYSTKKHISSFDSLKFCCNANLTYGFIFNKEDFNCLHRKFNELPRTEKITKLQIGAYDWYFNRTFLKCPGGDKIEDELWALNEPKSCEYGKCEDSDVYVNFCNDCSEAGLGINFLPPQTHYLCMEESN